MIALRHHTGLPQADNLLRLVITGFEKHFPGQIAAYYLAGSYSDGSAVEESDLDLVVLFAGSPDELTRQQFRKVSADLVAQESHQLECIYAEQSALQRYARASLRTAVLLYGTDLMPGFPPEPVDLHIQRSVFLAVRYAWVLRGQRNDLAYPLAYPDAAGMYYGYERFARYAGENDFRPGLRLIVSETTMIATVLVALASGRQAGTKRQAVDFYRQTIGGPWADYVEHVFITCKVQWRYRLPEMQDDQRRLRDLCAALVDLENHFLLSCREIVLANCHHTTPEVVHFAQETLNRIKL